MEKRIARMYVSDCLTILLFLILTWSVLAFVLRSVISLTSSLAVRIVLDVSAGTAGVFATAALIAVLVHLRKNRQTLYREDLAHLPPSGKE